MNTDIIKEMRHAIGLDYQSPQCGKYRAYRNYCMYNRPSRIWESLIKDGFAACRYEQKSESTSDEAYWYYLTRAGLDLIETMIGAKIEEVR